MPGELSRISRASGDKREGAAVKMITYRADTILAVDIRIDVDRRHELHVAWGTRVPSQSSASAGRTVGQDETTVIRLEGDAGSSIMRRPTVTFASFPRNPLRI